ncbi:MAG: fructosamine kinase family protein [Clostridiales bacterium]|nr:fructosamine kinase family protein [Clostridiales bacterium]
MKFYSLEEAVKAACGENLYVAGQNNVYGGDINMTYRLTLSDGSYVFLKANSVKNLFCFKAEEEGLAALRSTNTIGVPRVLAVGGDVRRGVSFLLMEYLESAPMVKNYWEIFGHELAMLHRAETAYMTENKDTPFGFKSDNYIGANPQKNTPKSSWAEFFRDYRLIPQMKMAENKLNSDLKKKCEKLLDRLDSLLPEPEFPSLLHGDLWSGNAVCGPDGKAWILDPAVYVGHFEAELAMTELFGGFSESFYGAYNEINPIDSGYDERMDLYNLYHMLNHLNLFGDSYLRTVSRILNKYV